MVSKFKRAFFAYPAQPIDLTGPIETAVEAVNARRASVEVIAWPQLDNFGSNIPDEIRERISTVDAVVCDITRPNVNVYYEAGFAIGSGKSVAPVLNASFATAASDVQRDGIFDNIRFKPYENSSELAELLAALPSTSLAALYAKPLNSKQPLYFLSAYRKTDFINAVASAIKASRIFFRSFDPVEESRFSTVLAIAEATASAGLVIPILASHVDDSARHNLRAAFLTGLGHGLGRPTLLIRLQTEDRPLPADYRELVKEVRNPDDIKDIVVEFAKNAVLAAQSIDLPKNAAHKGALQSLSIGASAAENEFRSLEDYFVETAEYVRTLRGEVRVVTGRKGSGKTAIFFMVRDALRNKDNVVADLKPESHQLSLFRQNLLALGDVGVFDHTFAAFWYYLILSEVALSILRALDRRTKNSGQALNRYREMAEALGRFEIRESGDFTTRINRLGSFMIQEIERAKAKGERLTPERLTNIVFRDVVGELKALIVKNTNERGKIVVLFDNIDKGWPSTRVDDFDVRLVRLLVESLDKISRDFASEDRNFMSVVFLRNDIYELLIGETPDRGKIARANLDWTDITKLKQVIYKRLQASADDYNADFDKLWRRFFVSRVKNQESFDYCVLNSLMRPRFLINIVDGSLSNAINRGHSLVQEEDFAESVRQHSNLLIDDFGYEIRDVSGLPEDILYSLIGVSKTISKTQILNRLSAYGVDAADAERAFSLFLWYGVIGIVAEGGREKYIYDFDYNFKRLFASLEALGNDVMFVVNPAFYVSLSS